MILLNRPDYTTRNPNAPGGRLHIAKHRNGPTKLITVAFQGHYSRPTDMQQ